MARRRKGRPVDGVLILDKPQGITSNAALQKVRWLFGAQKAGHTGSLDPLATGVLPICFGEATKFSRYLLDADKGYFTRAKLGEIRDSGDSDGQVVSQTAVPDLSLETLEAVLSEFRGPIEQVPTMFSALKHQGKPLYEYARKGIEIDRPARPVTIYDLALQERTQDTLTLSVECSKGTYIRTLVEDIGLSIECGAHVEMLRRFKAGHFLLDQATPLEALIDLEGNHAQLDAFLIPTDRLLPHFPKIFVNNDLGRSLLHGQAVRILPSEIQGLVCLYVASELDGQSEQAKLVQTGQIADSFDHDNAKFCGVVEISESGDVQPKRLITFSENVS